MNVSTKILTLICGAALIAGISLIPSNAFAQSYGHGLYHHSERGILGGAGHYSYGDHYANQHRMHQGLHSGTPQYSAPQYAAPAFGYTGMTTPQMQYSGPVSQGVPTGNLYPGMVLPDGSVVVSVGQ